MPIGMVKLENEIEKKSFRGVMKIGVREGNSIIREDGKEYYVLYKKGKELKSERTFQGVRMMIIGKIDFSLFLFYFYFLISFFIPYFILFIFHFHFIFIFYFLFFIYFSFLFLGCENVGKTSFKRRIISLSSNNKIAHKKVLKDKKEEIMVFFLKKKFVLNYFNF
jgi:hypothetical protein